MNVYIGWPVEYSDMQWPAPAGFHVPSKNNWQAIYNAGASLWAWSDSNGTNLSTYLKMPMAGFRNYSDLGFLDRGSYGYYWSSTSYNVNDAYSIYFYSSYIGLQHHSIRSHGFPVRCIKNSPTIPTSSWTKLYWTSIESWWIFWNSTDWLISISSNGTTWYTLMDKNLWATTVYNYWDTLTEANCGKIYQRGNNYWFSWDANYDVSQITQSSTQVNVTWYWPWNYYESSTWITAMPRQSSARNWNNLRWWVSQWSWTKSVEVKNIYLWEGKTIVLSDMQWPCPAGYHVPSIDEWESVYNLWITIGAWTSSNNINFSAFLKLPCAWLRLWNSSISSWDINLTGRYFSSSYNTENYGRYLFIKPSTSTVSSSNTYRYYWLSIRPFKNSFVVPTSSWTVINWTLWSAWIFWNQTDGIISITSNWTTGYTIADKNLWATTVWSYWDTLTDANCGNVFQWWNNYAFPWTLSSASITTSSTQVNVTWYWPWNYYSSSTWITTNPRQSSANNWNNLRWWVSQWSSTIVKPWIKEVYIWTTKVYPKE